MGAATDGGGTYRLSLPADTLHPLEIEGGGQRVATLSDEGPTTIVLPEPVKMRVRPVVSLLAVHPKNLCSRLSDYFALLPNRGCVDPVLGIKDVSITGGLGLGETAYARHCAVKHRLS